MILNKIGQQIQSDAGMFAIGDRVVAIDCIYVGLTGTIVDITTDPDKTTDNDGIDIGVRFDIPENEMEIKIVEDRFSIVGGTPRTINDIAFDYVIMAPSQLRVYQRVS